jgi:thioredoxin reductase (NADPH)
MDLLWEQVIIYGVVVLLASIFVFWYLLRRGKKTSRTIGKIEKAIEYGLYEPVSLHPVIDPDICIGSGACIAACPEKDILGMVNGYAQTVNASNCVGHGACFHSCPVGAITLVIGTEKRGIDLPHISPEFETNISGIFIAGELGGMGLIKNAVEQGKQAIDYLSKKIDKNKNAQYDVVIVGAGPAGISATLSAYKLGLRYLTLEQDSIGGTVFSFPRAKVVMTSAMNLPLYGKVKLSETSKNELLSLWKEVLGKNEIKINQGEKVESIEKKGEHFIVRSSKREYSTMGILLAIGRRGSPRKLGVPGENLEKVAYRLLEPELIKNKKVLVVGGGDSAIESALLIAEEGNEVVLSYRGESFSRLKPKNLENIKKAGDKGEIKILYNSNVLEISESEVALELKKERMKIANDLVYIFAGGELPIKFLEKTGIKITKKFGEAILKPR